MRPGIELIHDPDCPNVDLARKRLRQALAAAGLAVEWREWNRGQEVPPHVRDYGSPTILVNGRDVAGVSPTGGACCRIYPDKEGRLGRAPSVREIGGALLEWRRIPRDCDPPARAAASNDGPPAPPALASPGQTGEETWETLKGTNHDGST